MQERQVEVKELSKVLRIVCWIFAGVFFIFFFLMVCMEPEKKYLIIYIIMFSLGIFFWVLGLCSSLFYKHKDIYSAQKMIRIKKGKIVFEILWEDVTKIIYTKPTFLSWFSLGGGYAFFIYCDKEFTDRGIQKGAKVFMAHYKEKDVYKIQRVIPVHINM